MQSILTPATETRLRKAVEEATRFGASAAKLILRRDEKLRCRFEAGEVISAGSQEMLMCTAEALVAPADGTGTRRGTSHGNRLDQLSTIVERAVDITKAAGSAAHFDAYPAPADTVPVETHSERTLAYSANRMIDAYRHMEEKIKAYDRDVHTQARAERVATERLLATAGGVCHSARQTRWLLFMEAQQTKGTDMVISYVWRDWGDMNGAHDPDAMADRVVADMRCSETIVKPPSGRVKAYLPPEMLDMLLWVLAMGINGRNVAKGESPLRDRLGEQVLAPSLTIIDDPHLPFAPETRSIDDDGVPTRRQTVFDKGVLKTFLYDLDTAGLAGVEPTGNTGCAPHNVVVHPGTRPSSELLKDIDDGLYIRELIGLGGPSIVNGDISCTVGLGFRVKNGEIVGRVKDTMITGNVYELLPRKVQLSSDCDYTGCLPHAVIEGLAVSSK